MADEEIRNSYKLSISGAGVAVDREIDQQTALAVLQLVMGGSPQTGAVGSPTQASERTVIDSRRLSLREVLEESSAKTIPEKIVTIGIFLRDHEGKATFSRDDNKGRFKSAGEPAPANYPRDFAKAIRAGWVAEDHQNAGEYYVTRRGDEVFARRFAGTATLPKSRRRGGVSTAGPVTEGDLGHE